MPKKKHDEENDLGIIEAVETLSAIADLDFDVDLGVTKKHRLVIQDREITYRTVHWLVEGDVTTTVRAVRDTFRTVLNYIRRFYRKEYVEGGTQDVEALEGIKNIMVLVGEAAKKLDRYTGLFKQHKVGSVRNVREFKQLQNFYINKIAPAEDEKREIGKLFTERVVPISEKGVEKERQKRAKHSGPRFAIVDLESVKKDIEYELFYLRKDDGKRFFDERLIRNMKLVCDFEQRFAGRSVDDPLTKTPEWLDKNFYVDAHNILESVRVEMEAFYKVAMKFREREVVTLLNKACMALMLAGNERHLLRKQPPKICRCYFVDFQHYLRRALRSPEYQRMLVYTSKRVGHVEEAVLGLIEALCRVCFTRLQGNREIDPVLQILIKQQSGGKRGSRTLSANLRERYAAIQGVYKLHPNGPVQRVLDSLGWKRRNRDFDPFIQENLPNQLFELYHGDKKTSLLRLPSPTIQSQVQKAEAAPEFRSMLRSYGSKKLKRKHLLINLQDRTTWHGHARSNALEEMQHNENFKKDLIVVTLPKDTDFYHQAAPYTDSDEAETFLSQLKDHVRSDAAGFYFPPKLQSNITEKFLDSVIDGVHDLYFEKRESLNWQERLNFIELFYLHLIWKMMDLTSADSLSLSCKDGIDKGPSTSALLYAFLHLIGDHPVHKEELDFIDLTLFGPGLLNRERNLAADRFERMVGAIEQVEQAIQSDGLKNFQKKFRKQLKPLYQNLPDQAKVVIPRKKIKT